MKKSLLAIALLGGSLQLVNAQEVEDSVKVHNLKEVVAVGKYYKKNYTAKESSKSLRVETSILNQPQNVQIITHGALSDQQVLGISDGLIRNVSGATKLEHWGDLYARINMRGARATAFLNGANIMTQWGPLAEDMSYVDRVEFVKGPAGFMISYGEPSGLYNIVTKSPFFSEEATGSVGVTAGSYNLYRVESDVNVKLNDKMAVRLNLMGKNAKSFRPYDFNDRYVVNPSVKYKLTDKTTLTAEYIYQKAKMSQVGSYYMFSQKGYAEFPREYTISDPKLPATTVNEHYANVNLQSQLSNNWKLTAQMSYMSDDQMGGDIWPSTVTKDDEVVRKYFFWKSRNEMKFAQAFLNGKLYTGNIVHRILTGLDMADKNFLADWSQGGELDDPTKPYNPRKPYHPAEKGYPVYDHSKPLEEIGSQLAQSYTSVYLQDEMGFLEDKIRLTLAGRYTDALMNRYGSEANKSKFTPRAGLSLSPVESLSIYGLYDQAFMPQLGILRDTDDVPAITGTNYEIGVKKDWMNGKWNTSLSIYKIIKNDELVSDPNNRPNERYSIVKGQSVAKGLELDVKGELFKGMNVILNYALTDNEVTKSNIPTLKVGDKVAGYAKHSFNTWLNYQIPDGALKGFGASLGYTFLKDRTTWNWNDVKGIQPLGDYNKWDAGLFWGNKAMDIRLNVFNLTDEYLYSGSHYTSLYYYYQAEAPRNWRLSISYKF
uniref:TonB-dependent siderophore receptor n=1 Tax=Ornithobacterium rhinotracheale TaxID=28251 RepID=UPI0039A4D3D6